MSTYLQPRPEVGEPAPWSFPVAERFTLDNGLAVSLYERPGQHVVSVGLSLDLPLASEPRASEGVAGVMADTLDQGTRSHPGESFADALERSGGAFDTSSGFSATQLFLDVPATHLAEALPLLGEAVMEPQLTDADVARVRGILAAQLQQQRANGSARADLETRAALIESAFRASRPRSGTAATVATIDGDLVRDFHARQVSPIGATLVIAGQLPDGVADMVRSALGAWVTPAPAASNHERPTGRARAAYLVDRPGAVQADVRLGRFTIDRTDPRWPDLTLGTYALGGAFLSRLNAALREDKGYTYGVQASTTPLRSGGMTTVSGSFRNEVVGDAVALMNQLLDLTERPFSPAEIDDARRYITGVQPLQYATASGVCNGVLALASAGLDADVVNTLRAAYAHVSPASATDAVAQLLPPDELSLVVVGDASALERSLAEVGIDVTVIGADGSI